MCIVFSTFGGFMRFSIIFCLLFLISCVGGINQHRSVWLEDNGKVKVLCTTEIIADIVRGVGGDDIDVDVLIPRDLDPHSYELVKGDYDRFEFANLIVSNGLGLERGSSLFNLLSNNERVVELGDEIMEEAPQEICTIDHHPDPHIWMDISVWQRTVKIVVKALSDLDEGRRGVFEERGELVVAELLHADIEILELLNSIPEEHRYLVTVHDAFNYFVKRYFSSHAELEDGSWRLRQEAPEGLSPESGLSSTDIRRILDYIEAHDIRVIFYEHNVNVDSLMKIIDVAKETGFPLKLSDEGLYSDTLGSNTYLEMMHYNAATIKRNLQ
jgi:manganese/zinc/iron transport system substrate-binding protein